MFNILTVTLAQAKYLLISGLYFGIKIGINFGFGCSQIRQINFDNFLSICFFFLYSK